MMDDLFPVTITTFRERFDADFLQSTEKCREFFDKARNFDEFERIFLFQVLHGIESCCWKVQMWSQKESIDGSTEMYPSTYKAACFLVFFLGEFMKLFSVGSLSNGITTSMEHNQNSFVTEPPALSRAIYASEKVQGMWVREFCGIKYAITGIIDNLEIHIKMFSEYFENPSIFVGEDHCMQWKCGLVECFVNHVILLHKNLVDDLGIKLPHPDNVSDLLREDKTQVAVVLEKYLQY